jgi:DNA-binding transcriptional LysR family regulator
MFPLYGTNEFQLIKQLLDIMCEKNSHIAMPRNLPPLNALRAFEVAGRHESFSRGAEELGVSHSAISKHVRGLEDRLGARLFRDLPRGVKLTQAGARYLAKLTPAFDAIAEASEEFIDRPAGAVMVNSETVFALKWLVPNLNDFYEQHPEVEIDLDAESRVVDLSRYEADLAIRFFSEDPVEEVGDLISDVSIYPFATPEIAAKIGDDPMNLLNFRLLRDRGGDPWGEWFRIAGHPWAAEQVQTKRRMRAMLAIEAVVAGQGVFLASSDIVEMEVRAGRLVRVFDIGFRQGSYRVVYGDGVVRRRSVRVFRDWLLDRTTHFRGSEENHQPSG